MPETYRKRPTTVEAVQWPCDLEILNEWIGEQNKMWYLTPNNGVAVWNDHDQDFKPIPPGHWILKGEKPGDFYPCAPNIFEDTYDKDLPGISTPMEVVDASHWSRHPLEHRTTPERRQVYTWLTDEEAFHQDLKFTEEAKTDGGDLSDDAWTYQPLMGRWADQILMYLHRADTLKLENPLGRQAAAKAVATAHGMLESVIRVYGNLPAGGFPSGHIDPLGEEADHG